MVVSLLVLLLIGCGGQKTSNQTQEEIRLVERAEVLSKVVESLDTTRRGSASVLQEVEGLQTLVDSVLAGKTGYGMFYLVNSGCSVCIGELIDFSHILKRTGLCVPLYVIPVSRGHIPVLEYYLELPEYRSGNDIYVLKHSLRGNSISARNKTVLVTYGNKIVKQFMFE